MFAWHTLSVRVVSCKIYYYVLRSQIPCELRKDEKKETGIPGESNMGKIALFTSRRGNFTVLRDSLEFSQGILAGKGPRESQPRKVGQVCLAKALLSFFFSLFFFF